MALGEKILKRKTKRFDPKNYTSIQVNNLIADRENIMGNMYTSHQHNKETDTEGLLATHEQQVQYKKEDFYPMMQEALQRGESSGERSGLFADMPRENTSQTDKSFSASL